MGGPGLGGLGWAGRGGGGWVGRRAGLGQESWTVFASQHGMAHPACACVFGRRRREDNKRSVLNPDYPMTIKLFQVVFACFVPASSGRKGKLV